MVLWRTECNRDRSFTADPRVTATAAALLSFAAMEGVSGTGRPAPASCWRPRAAVRRRAVVRASIDCYGSHGRRCSSPLRRSGTARSGPSKFNWERLLQTALRRSRWLPNFRYSEGERQLGGRLVCLGLGRHENASAGTQFAVCPTQEGRAAR